VAHVVPVPFQVHFRLRFRLCELSTIPVRWADDNGVDGSVCVSLCRELAKQNK
jgi:hypothetical protein